MYNKNDIIKMLENSDTAVQRGLIAIWERQTSNEKLSQSTHDLNGIGFNGYDAGILSSFAEQFRSKGWLSEKQMTIARKRIMKYAGQLAEIANAKLQPSKSEIFAEASECQWYQGIVVVQGKVFSQDDLTAVRDNENEITSWEISTPNVKVTIIND